MAATVPPDPFPLRPDDLTLDEFLRFRVRQIVDEEFKSREDVRQ